MVGATADGYRTVAGTTDDTGRITFLDETGTPIRDAISVSLPQGLRAVSEQLRHNPGEPFLVTTVTDSGTIQHVVDSRGIHPFDPDHPPARVEPPQAIHHSAPTLSYPTPVRDSSPSPSRTSPDPKRIEVDTPHAPQLRSTTAPQRQADRFTQLLDQAPQNTPTAHSTGTPDSTFKLKGPKTSGVLGKLSRKTVIGALSVVVLAVTGALLVPRFSAPASSVDDTYPKVVIDDRGNQPVPGFMARPSWSYPLPSRSQAAGFDTAAVVVSGTELVLLNPADGTVMVTVPDTGGNVEVVGQVSVAGKDALVWRTSGKLWWWTVGGDSNPSSVDINPNAKLSLSGGSALVVSSPTEVGILTDTGLAPYTVNTLYRPVAAHEDQLVQATTDGALQITDAAGEPSVSWTAEAPTGTSEVDRWLDVGPRLVALMWRDGEKRTVALYDLESGKRVFTAAAPEGFSDASFVTGQGGLFATFGPWVFNATTGKVLADGTEAGVSFETARGTVAVGRKDNTQVLTDPVRGFATPVSLLGIAQSGGNAPIAIVSDNGALQGLPSATSGVEPTIQEGQTNQVTPTAPATVPVDKDGPASGEPQTDINVQPIWSYYPGNLGPPRAWL